MAGKNELANLTLDEINKLPPYMRSIKIEEWHMYLKDQRKIDRAESRKATRKEYKLKNKDKFKAYRERPEAKEKRRIYNQEYYERPEAIEKRKKFYKEYYAKNRERILERRREVKKK